MTVSSKEPKNNYIIIAIDSTCIKVTTRGRGLETTRILGKGI